MIKKAIRSAKGKIIFSLIGLTVLLFFCASAVVFKQKNQYITECSEESLLQEGYKITVDSKTVCALKEKSEAEALIDQLHSKAGSYYKAESDFSLINNIEVEKGEFLPSYFSSSQEAKKALSLDILLSEPTAITKEGEIIPINISEEAILEKYIETDFETVYKYTYGVNKSYEKIISEGTKGTIKQFYQSYQVNGQTVSEELLFENTIAAPTNRIIEVGVTPSMQLASAELAYFITPYDGKISSDYGYRYLNGLEFHTGIDLVSKNGSCYGKTAVAAADGVVVESSYSSTKGHYIVIEHDFGFSTVYMHFSKRLVSKGDKVKAGDPIGKIGSSGRSTGAHLHFEIRLNGNHTNPENYLKY